MSICCIIISIYKWPLELHKCVLAEGKRCVMLFGLTMTGKIMFALWHFQEVIDAQEKTISDLLKAVGEQHDQLNNQKIMIKNLEEKVYN